jgi:hypothetical protein
MSNWLERLGLGGARNNSDKLLRRSVVNPDYDSWFNREFLPVVERHCREMSRYAYPELISFANDILADEYLASANLIFSEVAQSLYIKRKSLPNFYSVNGYDKSPHLSHTVVKKINGVPDFSFDGIDPWAKSLHRCFLQSGEMPVDQVIDYSMHCFFTYPRGEMYSPYKASNSEMVYGGVRISFYEFYDRADGTGDSSVFVGDRAEIVGNLNTGIVESSRKSSIEAIRLTVQRKLAEGVDGNHPTGRGLYVHMGGRTFSHFNGK